MKKYKIDKTKNIGTVIFVVEGGRSDRGGTELRLLKSIFANLLGYEVQELRRGCDEFIGHGSNAFSRVFALNLPKNQLTQLTDDTIDELFRRLRDEFEVKVEDCPVFFLYDRDFLSYKANELRSRYVQRYTDPYADATGNQGQLLLSYPAVESYLLSCLQENLYQQSYFLGKDLKPEWVNLNLTEDAVATDAGIVQATNEMDKGLEFFGLQNYDLDNLGGTLLGVYDAQQNKYLTESAFSLLSLVSFALLELGIIVCEEDHG